MADVFLGLGSNMNADANLRAAVAALRQEFGDVRLSTVYKSAAYGFDGDDFLNLVAHLPTDRSPLELIEFFESLHAKSGRVRSADKYISRPLDIDLLLYDDLVEPQPPLRLPRRDILEHSFVLRPLAEMAPDLVHPSTRRTMIEHWEEFDADGHPLTPVELIL